MDLAGKTGLYFGSGGVTPGQRTKYQFAVKALYAEGVAKILVPRQSWKGFYESNFTTAPKEGYGEEPILHGGTPKKTCRDFNIPRQLGEAGMKACRDVCERWGIDFIIVDGGGGSLFQLDELADFLLIPSYFTGATIDDDINGVHAIGFNTAVEAGVEAGGAFLWTTKSYHGRSGIVESMGRNSPRLPMAVVKKMLEDKVPVEFFFFDGMKYNKQKLAKWIRSGKPIYALISENFNAFGTDGLDSEDEIPGVHRKLKDAARFAQQAWFGNNRNDPTGEVKSRRIEVGYYQTGRKLLLSELPLVERSTTALINALKNDITNKVISFDASGEAVYLDIHETAETNRKGQKPIDIEEVNELFKLLPGNTFIEAKF